jgi:molecular chaperone GrpE
LKKPEQDSDPIDINLDAEPIAESPLDAAGTGPGASIEEGAAPVGGEPSAELQAALDQLRRVQGEKDEMYQTLVRRQADFENFRKRVERERQEDGRRSAMIVMEGLLPVLDAFERALAAPVEQGFDQHRVGYDLIYKQLWESLARHGLERIEAVGKPFDPFVHQAIERVETTEHEDGIVLEEFQRGYKMRDKVVRPSMVKVASHPLPAAESSSSATVS